MMLARRREWTIADAANGDSLRIAGLEWGRGERVALLLHANGLCAATWTVVAERLADHCRVVALDARGHGASSAPLAPHGYDWRYLIADVAQVVEQLETEGTNIVIPLCAGSSLGGVIGAALAAEQPSMFGRVMMLDPPVKPSEEMIKLLGLAWPSAPPNGIAEQARRRQRVWPSREVAATAWRGRAMFARWDPRAFDLYLNAGLRDRGDGQVELACAPEVEAAIFEMTGTVDLFERAPRVNVPVHIVRAAGGFFPPDLFQALAARLPRGTLSDLDGGHLLPMEMPEVVADMLIRELDTV